MVIVVELDEEFSLLYEVTSSCLLSGVTLVPKLQFGNKENPLPELCSLRVPLDYTVEPKTGRPAVGWWARSGDLRPARVTRRVTATVTLVARVA